MAAWLEDGQQPASSTLRTAICHPKARECLLLGKAADSDPLVREVCEWLFDNAPITAWGYAGALQAWPRALTAARERRNTGVPG
jgi:hypothetical protein